MQVNSLKKEVTLVNLSLVKILEEENLIDWIKKHDALEAELQRTRRELKD